MAWLGLQTISFKCGGPRCMGLRLKPNMLLLLCWRSRSRSDAESDPIFSLLLQKCGRVTGNYCVFRLLHSCSSVWAPDEKSFWLQMYPPALRAFHTLRQESADRAGPSAGGTFEAKIISHRFCGRSGNLDTSLSECIFLQVHRTSIEFIQFNAIL